jgi:hypothetical protein
MFEFEVRFQDASNRQPNKHSGLFSQAVAFKRRLTMGWDRYNRYRGSTVHLRLVAQQRHHREHRV